MARYPRPWLALPLLLLAGCTAPTLAPVDPPADRPGATAPLRPGAWNGLVRRAEPGPGLVEPACFWQPGTEVAYEARREITDSTGGEDLRRDSRLRLRFLERTAEGYVIERVETGVATIRQPGELPPVPIGEAIRAVQSVLLTQPVRIGTDSELATLGVIDEAATRDRVLREARQPAEITSERWSRAIDELRVLMAPPGFTQLVSRDLTALMAATCFALAVGEPLAVHAEREEPSFGITTGSRFEMTLLRVADGKATVRARRDHRPSLGRRHPGPCGTSIGARPGAAFPERPRPHVVQRHPCRRSRRRPARPGDRRADHDTRVRAVYRPRDLDAPTVVPLSLPWDSSRGTWRAWPPRPSPA